MSMRYMAVSLSGIRALIAKDRSCKTLLKCGLPACVFTLFLIWIGGGLAQFTALAGSLIAFLIVRKRKLYPHGRIAQSVSTETASKRELEGLSERLECHKASVRGIFLAWFALLLAASGFSLLASTSGYYFIFERITKISTVAVMVASRSGGSLNALATRYLPMALRAIDIGLIISVSFFLSVTASACIYWFAARYEAAESRRAST